MATDGAQSGATKMTQERLREIRQTHGPVDPVVRELLEHIDGEGSTAEEVKRAALRLDRALNAFSPRFAEELRVCLDTLRMGARATARAEGLRQVLAQELVEWSADRSWCRRCRTETAQSMTPQGVRVPKAHQHAPGCPLYEASPQPPLTAAAQAHRDATAIMAPGPRDFIAEIIGCCGSLMAPENLQDITAEDAEELEAIRWRIYDIQQRTACGPRSTHSLPDSARVRFTDALKKAAQLELPGPKGVS